MPIEQQIDQILKSQQQLEQILKSLEWINKLIDYCSEYKPEKKSMEINYQNLSAEIGLLFFIPDNIKRKIRNVKIPAWGDFEISGMMDESFNSIGELWTKVEKTWVLETKNLPSSEYYFLKLKGKLPREMMSTLVSVQTSANPDHNEDVDKYWLSAMIRDAEILEKMWNKLEVNDVTAQVKVAIEKCFPIFSKEIKEQINADRRWLMAGHGRDREEVFRTWSSLRRTNRRIIPPNEIIHFFNELTDRDTFSKFISMDKPFSIGNIRRAEIYEIVPETMYAEAITSLNLRQQSANGYLNFKKKEYIDIVNEKFKEKF